MDDPEDSHLKEATRRPLLVQRMCGYIRHEECRGCEDVVTPYGTGGRMCRELALEAVAMVIEDLRTRSPGEISQDNQP